MEFVHFDKRFVHWVFIFNVTKCYFFSWFLLHTYTIKLSVQRFTLNCVFFFFSFRRHSSIVLSFHLFLKMASWCFHEVIKKIVSLFNAKNKKRSWKLDIVLIFFHGGSRDKNEVKRNYSQMMIRWVSCLVIVVMLT